MVKTHLLFMIAVVSAFLLTLQLITLQILIRKAKVEESQSWQILDSVTVYANQNRIPLFLIDSEILGFVANNSYPLIKSNNYCNLLCSGRKITHLATLAQFSTQLLLNRFVNSLKTKGYTVLEYTDNDPTLIHYNLKVLIPLHLIIIDENIDIRKSSHVIHIVIFHERIQSQYWWHGFLHLKEYDQRLLHRQGIRKSHFKVSDSSAIYDKVEIIRSTIDGLVLHLPNPVTNFIKSPEEVKFIECDKVRANSFHSKYGRDESEESNSFRTKATQLLFKVKRLLDELEIPFWLSSGTCLGYYRQCDFITYSRDVDIGIFIDDYNPQMIDLFSVNDLPLIHSFGKIEDSFELSFIDGDIKLDVFFFYKEQNYFWNGGTQARTGLKFKYIFPRFSLCWTEFVDLKVRVPCETQAYIEANYGQNWFEPIKEWDWKSSPSNVEPNGKWPIDQWKDVIKLIPMPEL